jgi:hypothetical protein
MLLDEQWKLSTLILKVFRAGGFQVIWMDLMMVNIMIDKYIIFKNVEM